MIKTIYFLVLALIHLSIKEEYFQLRDGEAVEQSAMNFAWSFKPIFIWFFATFGFDMSGSKGKSRCAIHLSIFISLFWLFVVKIPFYSIRIYRRLTDSNFDGTSFVFDTNSKIVSIVSNFLEILFTIVLMVSYFGKWKSFWEKLQQLEDDMSCEDTFYRQLRRETTGGLVLFLLVYQRYFYSQLAARNIKK